MFKGVKCIVNEVVNNKNKLAEKIKYLSNFEILLFFKKGLNLSNKIVEI